MAEDFVGSQWDKKRINDQLGGLAGETVIVNKWRSDEVNFFDSSFQLVSRDIDNFFYLNHSTNNTLGVSEVAHYVLNSNSNDSSGNANNGADTAISYVTGKISNAASFNATTSKITVTDASTIQNIFDGGGSIDMWIFPDSDGEGSDARLISKDLVWYLSIQQESGGFAKLAFFKQFSGTSGSWVSTSVAVTIGAWNHVIITYDADAVGNDPTIYVNNASVALTESATPVGTRTTDVGTNLIIGNNSGQTRTFDGEIDDVRVYNTTLSTNERLAIYNSGSGHEFEGSGNVLGGNTNSYVSDFNDTTTQRVTQTARIEITKFLLDESATAPTALSYGTGTTAFADTQTDLVTQSKTILSTQFPLGTNITVASGASGIATANYVHTFTDQTAVNSIVEWGLFNVTTSSTSATPVAWYKLNDDASNTTVTDSSANSNTGTCDVNTDTISVPGKINKAFQFNGSTNDVSVTDAATIQDVWDGGGSVTAWLKVDTSGGGGAGAIVRKGTVQCYVGSTSGGFGYLIFIRNFSTTDGNWRTTNRDIPLGIQTHIAILYDNDSVSNDPVIYVNGVSKAVTEQAAPVGTRLTDVGSDLHIGNNSAGTAGYDGELDDVRLFDTTISAGDIATIYNSGNGTEGGAVSNVMYTRRIETSLNISNTKEYKSSWSIKVKDL